MCFRRHGSRNSLNFLNIFKIFVSPKTLMPKILRNHVYNIVTFTKSIITLRRGKGAQLWPSRQHSGMFGGEHTRTDTQKDTFFWYCYTISSVLERAELRNWTAEQMTVVQVMLVVQLICAGGFRFRQAHWIRTKDMDVLWNSGVRGARDYPEQRTRPLGWLLVARNSHVRTTHRQVLYDNDNRNSTPYIVITVDHRRQSAMKIEGAKVRGSGGRRAQSGGAGRRGDIAVSPLPPARGSGERCELSQWAARCILSTLEL